jgi:hypothetical protein
MGVFLLKGMTFRIVGRILVNMKPKNQPADKEPKKEAMMEVGKPAGWEPPKSTVKKFCPNCNREMHAGKC